MRITDLLDARSISLQAAPGNKEEALNQAVELMTQRGNISDKAAYRRQVGEREKESTTGIGEGIAIPHGKCAAVSAPGLAAMVIPRFFNTIDTLMPLPPGRICSKPVLFVSPSLKCSTETI
jgi:fructose PTS system EIIBC or EIIC component